MPESFSLINPAAKIDSDARQRRERYEISRKKSNRDDKSPSDRQSARPESWQGQERRSGKDRRAERRSRGPMLESRHSQDRRKQARISTRA